MKCSTGTSATCSANSTRNTFQRYGLHHFGVFLHRRPCCRHADNWLTRSCPRQTPAHDSLCVVGCVLGLNVCSKRSASTHQAHAPCRKLSWRTSSAPTDHQPAQMETSSHQKARPGQASLLREASTGHRHSKNCLTKSPPAEAHPVVQAPASTAEAKKRPEALQVRIAWKQGTCAKTKEDG